MDLMRKIRRKLRNHRWTRVIDLTGTWEVETRHGKFSKMWNIMKLTSAVTATNIRKMSFIGAEGGFVMKQIPASFTEVLKAAGFSAEVCCITVMASFTSTSGAHLFIDDVGLDVDPLV